MENDKRLLKRQRDRAARRQQSRQQSKPNTDRAEKQLKSPQCDDRDQRSYSNDAKWYKKLPELSNAITDNANFMWPVGVPYNLDYDVTSVGGDLWSPNDSLIIPGVATIWTVPWFGTSHDQNSALNVAKVRLYTYTRRFNSGATNYDPEDLFIHIAAATAICAKINEGMRLYGLIQKYSTLNRYIPKTLFAACGYNFEDFEDNIVDFRYQLNLIISRMASVNIPAGITYFDREAFMYSGVYSEGESIKDQLYMFAPAAYPVFQLDDDGAGELVLVRTSAYEANLQYYGADSEGNKFYSGSVDSNRALVNAQEFISELRFMINSFFDLNDFSIMNGDIAKAWSQLMKFQLLPKDYEVPIQFDLQVLEQIKNATIQDSLTTWINNAIRTPILFQNKAKNQLRTPDFFTVTAAVGRDFTVQFAGPLLNSGTKVVTAHAGQASEDIQLENTRLVSNITDLVKVHEEGSATSTFNYKYDAGSDMVVEVSIATNYKQPSSATNSPTVLRIQRLFRAMVQYDLTALAMSYTLTQMELHSRFEFLPKVDFVVKPANTSATNSFTNYEVFNYNNFAVFSPDEIHRLNELCIESLFYVD